MQLPRKFLLLVLFFSLANLAGAQLINLNVKNHPLEKVFLLIEQQSGYSFIYSSEMLQAAKPVSAQLSNETLAKSLDACFKDQPLTYSINEKHIIVRHRKPEVVNVVRILKGKVIDEAGLPLPGVSIVVHTSRIGTTSDSDGNFELINVPERFRLIVSGIQIEPKELFITSQSFVLVQTTQKLQPLDQMVVVGYGIGKRRYLVESVSKVKGDEITRQPISNPVAALTARVAGLQITQASGVPGSTINVRLRGRNSLVNGTDPLYIVDGVPYPSVSLNDVLGSGGGIQSSPLDNLNPASIESIEVLKDAAATAIYGSRGANGVILITTKKGAAGTPQVILNAYTGIGKITRSIDMLSTPEYLQMRREAFTNDAAAQTNSNAPDLRLWDTTRYTDWQRMLIGNTMRVSDMNASVSLGNAQTRILSGAGYRNESSVFAGNFGAEKVSGFLNVNHKSLNNKFRLSVSVSFMQNKSELPREDLTGLIRTAPNAPTVFNAQGKLNWENSTWTNPFSRVMQVFTARSETWQSNLQAGYMLMPGLELSLSTGYTFLTQSDKFRVPISSLNPVPAPVAQAGFGNKEIRTQIVEPQINYTRSFDRKHHIQLLAGGSFQLSSQKGLYQTGSGYSSDDLLGSLAAAPSISLWGESDIRYRYAAFFGRVQYDFQRKYLLNLSLRRDGSSRYGPQNRFANFSSIGLGWILTSEKWLAKLKWLSFAKIRLSAGTTGNDQIGDYKFLDLYSPYTTTYQGTTAYYPVQLFSPSFGWEQVSKLESGIDLYFFKNRVNLTINYYYNTTSNQLVNYTLPATTGFSGVLRNIPAIIRNKGWEMELGAELIVSKKWQWSVTANLTVPRNKLVSFENFSSSTYANTYVLGQPLNVVKLYSFQGVDVGTGLYVFKDYNNDGKISSPADQQHFVSTAVDFFGGMEHTLSYKKLTLSFHISFTKQPFARNYLSLFPKPGSIGNQPDMVLSRWKKQGDLSSIQRYTVTASAPNIAYNNLRNSDAAYSNASFVRLRNLQLSYKLHFAKIFLAGQNLLVATNYKGLDPETNNLLPPIKMVTAGVQFTF